MHTAGLSPLEKCKEMKFFILKNVFVMNHPQNELRIFIKIVPQGSFKPNDLYSGKALISCSMHVCMHEHQRLLLHLHIGLSLSSVRTEKIFNMANDFVQH